MRRILLFHDEPAAIDRLRRPLHAHEKDWEIHHSGTHAEAWMEVERWQPDAVVASVREPRLDGVALLTAIRDAHPEIVRILISGDGRADEALRALRIAHRALPEPADSASLLEALHRTFLLRDIVRSPAMRQTLGRVGPLPAVPSVYAQLSRKLAEPGVSTYELGELVALDVTLATQVLRIANSAYYGRFPSVATIPAAAARIGTRMLRSLVLTAEVYGRLPVSPFMAERLESQQRHASLVAAIASSLEPGAAWKDEALTSGLLHDVGKILLASQSPQLHESIVHEAERRGVPEFEVESQRFGVHHATLGTCLLGMWGLPSAILEAVSRHHEPIESLPHPLDAPAAVRLANLLAHAAVDSETGRPMREVPHAVRMDIRWPGWLEHAARLAKHDRAA